MDCRHFYQEPSPSSPSPPRRKPRPMIKFSCCPRRVKSEEKPPIRSQPSWIRMKARELPGIKQRCRGFITRIGNASRRPHGDFRYDPISYALNFDEGGDNGVAGEELLQFRNFSSRLPAAPSGGAGELICR
ncbi:hypothetical protein KSP40_PGU010245 [Platanthera guangdongensis]|uniref:Uncharacterized protein n=1 Tax=Platanthera guangdongensis TaxID=2320717 RepID=A0ABR2LFP6_9ASPA